MTINYPEGDRSLRHSLAFTESIDSISTKSTVSIGYVSYEPVKYFTRKNYPTITLDQNGLCNSLSTNTGFVPELSWAVQRLIPIPLVKYTTIFPHFVGPTGLLSVLYLINDNKLSVSSID